MRGSLTETKKWNKTSICHTKLKKMLVLFKIFYTKMWKLCEWIWLSNCQLFKCLYFTVLTPFLIWNSDVFIKDDDEAAVIVVVVLDNHFCVCLSLKSI